MLFSKTIALTSAAAFSSLVQGATHTVAVGAGGLKFEPAEFKANVGDFVKFEFYPVVHSVAESTFDKPCEALPEGFYSGEFKGSNPPTDSFTIEVNEAGPIWFFCPTDGHCQGGMSGVINGEGGSEFLAAYQKASAGTETTDPGEPRGEAEPPSSESNTPSGSETAPSGSPTPSGSPSGTTTGGSSKPTSSAPSGTPSGPLTSPSKTPSTSSSTTTHVGSPGDKNNISSSTTPSTATSVVPPMVTNITNNPSAGLSNGVIIGITISAVVALGIVAGLIMFIVKHRQPKVAQLSQVPQPTILQHPQTHTAAELPQTSQTYTAAELPQTHTVAELPQNYPAKASSP